VREHEQGYNSEEYEEDGYGGGGGEGVDGGFEG
jgi:hypothetical protein